MLSLLAGLILSACSQNGAASPIGGSGASEPAPGGTGTGTCAPASAALVSLLQAGVVVRGATLSNVQVVAAPRLDTQSDATPPFAHGWWVAGKLTGAGVRPEVVVWLLSEIDAPRSAKVVAANAAAQRYSRWSSPGGALFTGPGLDAVVSCVGPMPAS